MIKAVLFDYDGVMTKGVDVTQPTKKLAANTGVPVGRAEELMRSVWGAYMTGHMSTAELWTHFEKQLNITIDEDKRDIWFAWEDLKPLPLMQAFVRELRFDGYQVGLVSNIFLDTAKVIRQNGGYEGFDFLVLSCEVGARKPEIAIFDAAFAKLGGMKPDEVIFLDDRPPITEAAAAYGMHAVLVTDHHDAIRTVKALIA